jgi:hypothetical protein
LARRSKKIFERRVFPCPDPSSLNQVQNDVSHTPQDCLAIHSALAEELRHSDGIVWQFALAIIALEDGAVILSGQSGFQNLVGKGALAAGFLLSVCLSFVLVRHAYDRRGFVTRIHAVEDELRKEYPKFFVRAAGSPQWLASMLLAWILLAESAAGFVLFVTQLYQ